MDGGLFLVVFAACWSQRETRPIPRSATFRGEIALDKNAGAQLWSTQGIGTDAYRIGSGLTVMNGHLIVTEGFQLQLVKSGPGDASVGGIRVYGLP